MAMGEGKIHPRQFRRRDLPTVGMSCKGQWNALPTRGEEGFRVVGQKQGRIDGRDGLHATGQPADRSIPVNPGHHQRMICLSALLASSDVREHDRIARQRNRFVFEQSHPGGFRHRSHTITIVEEIVISHDHHGPQRRVDRGHPLKERFDAFALKIDHVTGECNQIRPSGTQ